MAEFKGKKNKFIDLPYELSPSGLRLEGMGNTKYSLSSSHIKDLSRRPTRTNQKVMTQTDQMTINILSAVSDEKSHDQGTAMPEFEGKLKWSLSDQDVVIKLEDPRMQLEEDKTRNTKLEQEESRVVERHLNIEIDDDSPHLPLKEERKEKKKSKWADTRKTQMK